MKVEKKTNKAVQGVTPQQQDVIMGIANGHRYPEQQAEFGHVSVTFRSLTRRGLIKYCTSKKFSLTRAGEVLRNHIVAKLQGY
ncbi:hypothetical protein [Vibrio methylphosphonaticus]|uniref:hypothetical protein n=1 Tax=Vibrio methylphosphonaticus TaxID=2946866 RepID=UPI002029FCBF|nr:hypothetical protein [Vibrio methylphosphonaticus]MCL9773759.1 hypothetical protein [Vibrio methylphosphonaticus]